MVVTYLPQPLPTSTLSIKKFYEKKKYMPELVYIGLLGINSKSTAYVYLAISLILGLVSIYLGFSQPKYFLGAFMFLATGWYFYAINWVDKNSGWEN